MKKILILLAIGIVGFTSCDKRFDVSLGDKPLPKGTFVGTAYYVGDGTINNSVEWRIYSLSLSDMVISLANQINDCNLNPALSLEGVNNLLSTLYSIRYEYKFQSTGNETIEIKDTIEDGTYICMATRQVNYDYPYLTNMGRGTLGEYLYKTLTVQSGQITTVDFMFQYKISNATEFRQ